MATLCAACIATDRTADRYASGFVDHCFTTLHEAMLVSRESWVGAWKYWGLSGILCAEPVD